MGNTWEFYGDVNYMEHGGSWVQKQGDGYAVVKMTPLEQACGEPGYLFDVATVYLDEFNLEEMADFIGTTPGEASEEVLAVVVLEYYGAYQLGGSSYVQDTSSEAQEELGDFGIEL